MSKPAPKTDAESLGAKIDAVLAPFAADEARLQESISGLEAQIAKLQDEIEGSRNDLSVVQSSKIESLREAAKSDPLLSVAFAGLTEMSASAPDAGAEELPMAPEADADAEEPSQGGHALLNM